MPSKDTPQEVADKFLVKVKESPFIMLGLMNDEHAEVMNVKLDEAHPNALFVFAGKQNRAAGGGDARVEFVGHGHDFFASLLGTITPDHDQAQVDKLWDKRVEAWFPNGKADAVLLRFDVNSAELWETDVSVTGRVKMLFGGTIKAEESSSYAKVDSIA